jgi:hypothetical protein
MSRPSVWISAALLTVAVTTSGLVRSAPAQPATPQPEVGEIYAAIILVTVNAFVDNLDALYAKKRDLMRTMSKDAADAELKRLLVTAIRDQAATIETQYRDVQKKARLAADESTLIGLVAAVGIYFGRNDGRFPPDKAAVAGLLATPPRFQCPGNDFTYDPGTGKLALLITDAARC